MMYQPGDKAKIAGDLLIICAVWVLMLVITNPVGNFSLNDDWNYAWSVKVLLDEHRLLITHWALAASVTHIFMGWCAAVLFGFSFDTLRTVTMIAGFGASVCVYLLGRHLSAPRSLSVIGALCLLTNPLFFNLATTFMTDVAFFLFAALSLLVFMHVLKSERLTASALFWCSALVVAACLIRQTGVVIAIGFVLSALIFRKDWFTSGLIRLKVFIPLLSGVAATAAFQWWLTTNIGTLHSYRVERAWLEQMVAQGPLHMLEHFVRDLMVAGIYVGIFIMPLAVVCFPRFLAGLRGKERNIAIIMFVEPLVLVGLGVFLSRSIMPLGDNILFDIGLGPLLLPGEPYGVWPGAGGLFWPIVTAAGIIGASAITSILVILVSRLIARGKFATDDHLPARLGFLITTLVVYSIVICFRGFFDRYLLFNLLLLIPVFFIAAGFAADGGRASRAALIQHVASILLLLAYAVFAVAGTHDYFSWNRARWQGAHYLVQEQQISPMEIDGGLEFNGWYGYAPEFRHSTRQLKNDMKHGDNYLIALRPVSGYEVMKRFQFIRWMPPGTGEIFVLRRASTKAVPD